MKCIFLVAGYATRLFPLTKDKPKALLEIGGHPILDYILSNVNKIDEIDEIITISNHKFYPHFCEWSKKANTAKKITVLDDNTTDDTNKLGAIGDIWYAIEKCGIDEDVMILAGDNLFTFDLKDFYAFFKKNQTSSICVHKLDDINELKRMGVAILDENNRVLDMVEKPENPPSTTAVDPFYIYPRGTLPMIKKYLDEGNKADAPGNLPSWLHKQEPVLAHWIDGYCIDIGTVANYEYVNQNFDQIFGGKLTV